MKQRQTDTGMLLYRRFVLYAADVITAINNHVPYRSTVVDLYPGSAHITIFDEQLGQPLLVF